MTPESPAEALQSRRFLWLYALAAAGGAIAYVPFLTILLPMRMTELAGSDDVAWLAYATFAGAVAASFANILSGWASDWTGTRVPWIAAGLVLSCLLLVSFAAAPDVATTLALLVAWQCALNMMLGPLAAWAGDCVPDAQKGRLGGLLAMAPASGAVAGVLVTWPGLAAPEMRLGFIAGLVALCVAPVLLFGRPRRFPELTQEAGEPGQSRPARARVVRMWLARLLVQISEAALFAFLYFWFRSIDPTITDALVAQVFGVILLAAVPLAFAAGRWADRNGRPFAPLIAASAVATIGLLVMASAQGLGSALAGYVAFGLAASVFLSLHTAQTLRVLPRPGRRGRDLGYFNLTNTGPSLVMPWLAVALVPEFGFAGLFAALATCALGASWLLMKMPRAA